MKILFVCSLTVLVAKTVQADPTRPPLGWQATTAAVVAPQTRLPQLQLIKQAAQGRVALIDGTLVRQGERYQHYLVQRIHDSSVILELNGQQLMLPLLNTAIKHYE